MVINTEINIHLVRRVHVQKHERGLLYRRGDFERILMPGSYWLWAWPGTMRVEIVTTRYAVLNHLDLEVLAKSGALEGQAQVLDLKDHERALIWLDGRFSQVCGPGLHAFWTDLQKVRHEVVDIRENLLFDHPQLTKILEMDQKWLNEVKVQESTVGVLFLNGQHKATLKPGSYAVWRHAGQVSVRHVDCREQVVDISGQDIMTADKVTVRLNALVTFRVEDALRALTQIDDFRQALYRETQLAMRAAIGSRELDPLLGDKDGLIEEVRAKVALRAKELGLEIVSTGIRDIILPGEMKTLMNRVTEAKKAAEANLIVRREETAAMRSQANSAKILENNPALMKMRELEVLEKIAVNGNLSVMLSENGLGERIMKLV